MRVVLMMVLLLAAACAQEAAPPEAEPAAAQAEAVQAEAPAPGCTATATGAWQGFRIEASAAGATCANAVATLTLRNDDGAEVYRATHNVEHVMVLAGAQSDADLQRMLNEWVNPPGAALNSTGDLAPWPASAPQTTGEFPFYPEEGLDRAAYQALRAGDAPMFCYVQGMESLACLVAENGVVRKIGVQSFPG